MASKKMTKGEFYGLLTNLGACAKALDYVRRQKRSPQRIWETCGRNDWLEWLLERTDLLNDTLITKLTNLDYLHTNGQIGQREWESGIARALRSVRWSMIEKRMREEIETKKYGFLRV